MQAEDQNFMRLAIEEAHRSERTSGSEKVGCVIVKSGRVLASSRTEVAATLDPTAHAEIVAIRRLGQRLLTTDFTGCTLFSTLQPCCMCAAACVWAKIKRIVYGVSRHNLNPGYLALKHADTSSMVLATFRNEIEVVSGVLSAECAKLYDGSESV